MTPHFRRGELMCKCGCARAEMSPGFMQRLEALRLAFNKPMIITSGYRCPRYNSLVAKTGAYLLVLIAMQMGFTGLGIQQAGPHISRIIHIDDLPLSVGEHGPRPRIWSY